MGGNYFLRGPIPLQAGKYAVIVYITSAATTDHHDSLRTTTLLQCVSNLVRWTGIDVARALKTVTCNPARLLGMEDVKGTLRPGADADLVVLSWENIPNQQELRVDQVWKFGKQVYP